MTEYHVMAEEEITMMNIEDVIEYFKFLRDVGVKRVSGKLRLWEEDLEPIELEIAESHESTSKLAHSLLHQIIGCIKR